MHSVRGTLFEELLLSGDKSNQKCLFRRISPQLRDDSHGGVALVGQIQRAGDLDSGNLVTAQHRTLVNW